MGAMHGVTRTSSVDIVWSVLGILVCGSAGGTAGWFVTRAFDLTGVWAAVVAVPIGMVVAVACWVALTSLLRSLNVIR